MAVGLIEIPFFGVTAIVADRVLKAAPIKLVGFETTGNERLLVRLCGEVAAVEYALQLAASCAQELGVSSVVVHPLNHPSSALQALTPSRNSVNPLYGGPDQFLPSDDPKINADSMKREAIGIIETQGLAAVLEATDVMLKAANVSLVGKEKIGAAYVAVIVRGDVAAVSAAVQSGAKAVGGLGKLVAAHVIARPHDDLVRLLPQ